MDEDVYCDLCDRLIEDCVCGDFDESVLYPEPYDGPESRFELPGQSY